MSNCNSSIRIGPAGNDNVFYEKGNKATAQIPAYLSALRLNAYEYQCGRGVNISEEKCKILRPLFSNADIEVSLHAPYYISMSSVEEDKRLASVGYIEKSARACYAMGGRRVIFHSGSCKNLSRTSALDLASDTVKMCLKALKKMDLYDKINICPETMGKINQLGTEQEVAELCALDEMLIPCIDFGHINARTGGSLRTVADFEKLYNVFADKIGSDRMKCFHSHFSKIEYTAGGEKKHLTFEDNVFGPEFEPLAELIYKKSLTPTIICESDGTQAADAVYMMNVLDKLG